jgi:AraC-like DNA-binding protein
MSAAAWYEEWRPPPALTRHLACTWAGRMGPEGETYVRRVLPDGCLDILWDGRHLVLAGPDTGPVDVAPRAGGFYVGVRFRTGLAPTVLGVPASELLDQRVEASAVVGAERAARLSQRLSDRLGSMPDGANSPSSLRALAAVLEDAVAGWLPGSAGPDRLVGAAVAALGTPGVTRPVATLADRLGVSERQLHRRCVAAVGYGPKTLDRVLRFRRFLALAAAHPQAGLARLAADAGYADQPHLNRECLRLAGSTPAALVPSRLEV